MNPPLHEDPITKPQSPVGLGLARCHPVPPNILPWETGTARSSEGMATGGMQPGGAGWMEKKLLYRGQALSVGVQHPGKGRKGTGM